LGNQIKILVTGVGGYIGSRACSYLSTHGFDVVGLMRQDADFGDKDRMAEILNDTQPDVVLHTAGVTPHTHVNDGDYSKVNFEGSKNLLNALLSSGLTRGSSRNQKDSPIKSGNDSVRFINCSTIGVYGVPLNDGVVHEDDVCTPLSPYAQSKHDFEKYLSGSDISHVNVRIANIPGRDAFINYVADNNAVNFYGDEPYIRDYIHLDDLNNLFQKSIGYLIDNGESITVNAGAGVGYCFPDIVDEIESQMGTPITRNHHPTRPNDVVKIICDIQRAKNVLGWMPQQTDLKEIIKYALHNRQL